ncbi:MAG: hypothetical protein QXZ48_07890 [Zestosphaera sp.]
MEVATLEIEYAEKLTILDVKALRQKGVDLLPSLFGELEAGLENWRADEKRKHVYKNEGSEIIRCRDQWR